MKCACPIRPLLMLVVASITKSAMANDPVIFERSFPLMAAMNRRLPSVAVVLAVNEPGSVPEDRPTTFLFEDFFWTPLDQSGSAIVDESVDPDFALVTSVFTNGLNDRVWTGTFWNPGLFREWTLGVEPESAFFSGTDLRNYRISRIQLTLDRFRMEVPGRDPNGDGRWTELAGEVTFTFYGMPVPEPGSVSLLLMGFVLFLAAHQHRRRISGKTAMPKPA